MDCLRRALLVLAGLALVGAGTTAFVLAAVGALEVTVYEVEAKTNQQTLLDGATVIVTSADGKVQKGGTTIGGQVTFAGLPEGNYKVEVKMATYGGRIVDVKVLPNRINQLAVGLTPERTTEVTVRATEDVVELEKGGQTSTKISEDFFDDLPVLGREYQSVLTLAPGVQDDDGDGNPNVHGARDRDFKMSVDGVSNVDPLTGQFQSFVNADAIEEIEIIDSGADASMGGAVGGYGKIITKTGGNEFEGTFNFFFRDSTFDNDLWGDRDPQKFGLIRPSIFLSGPIVKDHLWFVINHEYIDLKDPIDLVGGGDFVQKQTSFRSMDKVTWQVTPKNKVSFQYSADPLKVDPAGVSSTAPPETGVTYEQGGPVYTAKWTAPFSPTFFWEATVAFSDIKREYHPVDTTVLNTCVDPNNPQNDNFKHLMCLNNDQGRFRSGVFFQDFQDFRRRWTYALDAEQYIQEWLGGSHRLKIGGVLENVQYDREKLQRNRLEMTSLFAPTAIFDPEGGLGSGSSRQRLIEFRYSPERGGTDLRTNGARGNYYHAYLSDTYEPLPNLSITVGARFFREEMTAPGRVPFDPRAERDAWKEYLDKCEEFFIGFNGRPVPVAICWARFVQGGTFAPPPIASDFPIGTGFTFHPGDLPTELGGNCANRVQCLLLSQANAGPGGLDYSNQRQNETYDIINNNLEPRLSVAWDPNNDGKTKVAFNWGRFHNQTFLSPLVDEADSDVTRNYQTYIDGAPQSGSSDVSEIDGAWEIRAIDRNLRSSAMDEWGVSVEREIAPETSLRVRYLHRQFKDQLQDKDVNHSGVLWDDAIHGPLACTAGIPQPGCCLKVGKFADCTGKEALDSNGSNPRLVQMPDGVADLELISPFFNNIYLVGNFNSSNYEAYILELTRRYYQNWELQASYTWSKAIGQAEDYNSGLGDDPSNADDEVGFLSYDRRHVVKINGRVMLPYWGGIRIGGAFSYQTGLPYSLMIIREVLDAKTNLSVSATRDWSSVVINGQTFNLGSVQYAASSTRTIFPTGRRNDQRNSPYWNFNLNLQKDFDIRNIRATAQLDIFNVLNDDSLILAALIKQERPLPEGGFGFVDIPIGTRRQGRIFQAMIKLNF